MLFSRLVVSLFFAGALASVAQRPVPPPTANVVAADFHRSNPKTIGATGRPQLLEFFGPT